MSTIKSSSEHLTLNADGASKDIKLQNNGSESARIDSSGNVLVAQSSTSTPGIGNTTVGSALRSDGVGVFSVSDNPVAYFNRSSSDGDIAKFLKDGSTVGSIGTYNNDIYWGTDDTGLTSSNGSNALMPFNPSTVAVRDAGIDLGINTVRFKDLYLSGGVRLGGTGTANALDDYEEGSWTAAFSPNSGSITTHSSYNTGYYTKIGNKVFFHLHIRVSAISSPSGSLKITGLPFTSASDIKHRHAVTIDPAYNLSFPTDEIPTAYVSNGVTFIYINATDGSGHSDAASWVNSNTEVFINGSYVI
jgi:hypothetical protein